MSAENKYLKYRSLWLFIGYTLIVILIYQTLTDSPVSVGVSVSDKFMHTVGYFILMGWFVQVFHSKKQRFLWAIFFIAMGISMEFLQGLGGVRFYEVKDMLANGLGVVIAWVLSHTKFSNTILLFEKYVLKVNRESIH
jgi:VanZ family protein